jgi:trimeric autotransporter adhesin
MKSLIGSVNRSPLRCGFFTMTIALCWFALSPPLKAQDCPSECGAGGNTGVGINALDSVNPAGNGINNTAVGLNALTSDTIGQYNVAVGSRALENNITGDFNMAIGTEALQQNNASFNLAIGFRVAFQNTTGRHLTGIGAAAMRNNQSGDFNTAIGADALRENTTTGLNVAVGDSALAVYNGAGTDGANTAVGSFALSALTSDIENVAVGRRALEFLTSGGNNVSVGWRSGDGLTNGSGNTFLGNRAGAIAPSTGQYNNTILLGIAGDSNATNPDGRAYIGHVRDVTPGNGIADSEFVIIDSDGNLGSATGLPSARRFKKDIKPMDHKISEAVLALKPVTFHYNNQGTKDHTKAQDRPQFGLIAEEVAEVNPDLVTRDKDGEIYTVRYDAVNVMLLNEFLKEHKKVEEQQVSIADLKSTVALQQKEMQVLTAQLKEQAAQIQKVSAQLETSKPAPKVVANK